jgi:signal transduction histidine kinase
MTNKILIVDDEPNNLKILHNFLYKAGFKVLVAKDGETAIKQIEHIKPDLILLDVTMPGLDGFETCQHLKENATTQDMPIIFITAKVELADKIKGLEIGAVDYITKPFQAEEVISRVNKHLAISNLKKQLEAQNFQLQQEIIKRKQAEAALIEERSSLAQQVEKRTYDLYQANQELAHASRLKDEFLANMSHEFRTPLNAIIVFSELLFDDIQGPLNKTQLESVKHIQKAGNHLLSLINDILDLSRIAAGKMKLNIAPVQVNTLCKDSLQLIRPMALKKQIKLLKVEDGYVTTILADERGLQQILINLLTNAVKFTPEGGQIQLEIIGNKTDGIAQFSVIDTGIGIPENEIEQLFQPFVQLDGGLSRQQEGTGLGLALVYKLTKLHGGSVNVESEIGKGSCFKVLLPWQGDNL